MDVEEIRDFALQLGEVEESFPFGDDTLVFKVGGKIFLLMGLNHYPLQFNVKCDPDLALELREQYPDIIPGFHMNKKHWNTIIQNGSIPRSIILEQISNSYNLVKKKGKKKT